MFHQNANSLEAMDSEIYKVIVQEKSRQEEGLELIASENYVSPAVMQAQGSVLTNKYAEGLPNKRYYGGCEFVDKSEQLAIDRVKKLFNAEKANVQPHSGAQANMAVYFATLSPGDKVLGMNLAEGGHLTHGSPVNFSGKFYNVISYGVDPKSEQIDYNILEEVAKREKPKLIIGGASAYPRIIDFEKMGEIARSCGALFMVDMAHIAGLVATGFHPSPIGHADYVTSTTHKTLRGPRGGFILTGKEHIKKINSNVFPGIQGGPLEHVIAAKAVSFNEALQAGFNKYQEQVLKNAKALADRLQQDMIELVSGGTENHLLIIKTNSVNLSGKEAEEILGRVDITVNKNMIPGDKRSPFVTSGIRIGSAAITTRGFNEEQCTQVAEWISKILRDPNNEQLQREIKESVQNLCKEFPVYR